MVQGLSIQLQEYLHLNQLHPQKLRLLQMLKQKLNI
jgi:hypothetical protein